MGAVGSKNPFSQYPSVGPSSGGASGASGAKGASATTPSFGGQASAMPKPHNLNQPAPPSGVGNRLNVSG
jgi:hypothetical protein